MLVDRPGFAPGPPPCEGGVFLLDYQPLPIADCRFAQRAPDCRLGLDATAIYNLQSAMDLEPAVGPAPTLPRYERGVLLATPNRHLVAASGFEPLPCGL
jgi:hypothetical protein